MPDISMCFNQECQVKTKCYRHPASGTVATAYRQAWSGFPGPDETCPGFSSSWDKPPTLGNRVMRTVEHFCSYLRNREHTYRNYNAPDFKAFMRNAFANTISDTDSLIGDDIIAWFKQGGFDSDDVIDVIHNNLLAVVSILDTHDGGTRYIDQVVMHFDKPQPKMTVIRGNGTVN